jgi:hypothetical protein
LWPRTEGTMLWSRLSRSAKRMSAPESRRPPARTPSARGSREKTAAIAAPRRAPHELLLAPRACAARTARREEQIATCQIRSPRTSGSRAPSRSARARHACGRDQSVPPAAIRTPCVKRADRISASIPRSVCHASPR